MNIRCILIDDESDNRENLRLLLDKYCPQVEVLAEAASAEEGIKKIREHQPDLLFLDVEMPEGSGFDLLKRIGTIDFEVVFVTAYNHYAVKAIKFNALDYLLKPVDIDELVQAVEKVAGKLSNRQPDQKLHNLLANLNQQSGQQKRLPLATTDRLHFIPIEEIIHLESESNYTRFFILNSDPLLVAKTLKEYEAILSGYNFIRPHQSHLVNPHYIKTFVRHDGGYLLLTDETRIEVARSRKEEILKKLNAI